MPNPSMRSGPWGALTFVEGMQVSRPHPYRQHLLTIGILVATVVLWTSRRVHANTVSPTKTCFTQYDIIGELSKLTIPR